MIKTSDYTKLVVITLGMLGIFLLFSFLLKSAVSVLLLIFAGILFAIFIRGLSKFLFGKFRQLPEKAAIAVTLLLLIIALTAFFTLLAPQLAEQGERLVEQISQAVENMKQQSDLIERLEDLVQSKNDSLSFLPPAEKLTSGAFGIFSTTFGFLSSLFIILFIGLYLSFSPEYYIAGILDLVPESGRRRAGRILNALDYTLGHWLIGRFIGMLVVGVFTFVGLLFLNIPLPLSLAVLAGLLTFLPNIGPIISAVPAVLLGFAESSATAFYVILLYLLIQGIESYIITPLVQQREVSLPPVLTLSSQVLLGTVFGLLGLALATPLTATVLVLVKMLYIEDVLGKPANIDAAEN